MAIDGDFGIGVSFLVLKCCGSSVIFYSALGMMGNNSKKVLTSIEKRLERIKKEINLETWFRDD